MPDTGSGYGGKQPEKTAIEAARLARAAKRPVKLVWTREEEFTWAYFRPAGVIDVKSGVRATARSPHGSFTTTTPDRLGFAPTMKFRTSASCSMRSNSPLAAGFVPGARGHRKSFCARVAHGRNGARLEDGSSGVPPEEPEERRLRAVFEAAAKKFGWGKSKSGPDRDLAWAADTKSWATLQPSPKSMSIASRAT